MIATNHFTYDYTHSQRGDPKAFYQQIALLAQLFNLPYIT